MNDGTVALLYEATSNTVIRLLILDLGDIGGGEHSHQAGYSPTEVRVPPLWKYREASASSGHGMAGVCQPPNALTSLKSVKPISSSAIIIT